MCSLTSWSLGVSCDFQVGLAVGDIDKIQVNALIDRYVMQVGQQTRFLRILRAIKIIFTVGKSNL